MKRGLVYNVRRVQRLGGKAARRVLPQNMYFRLRGIEIPKEGMVANSVVFLIDGEQPDFCRPLDDPTWLTVEEATLMRDDDAVVGFYEDGNAWAFPWWIMKNHHLANLTLNDRPRLVAFCEACATGAVYDPVVKGRQFTFEVEGHYNGAQSAIDHQTKSLWSLVLGAPVAGPAFGKVPRLERAPVVQDTWGAWKARYPQTLVVDGTGEPRDGHGSSQKSPDHQERIFESSAPKKMDDRLPLVDLIVAVMAPAEPRAYPIKTVQAQGGIVHDEIGDLPVVVVAKSGSWLAVAYDRRVDGQELTFKWAGDEIVDAETGTHWDEFGNGVSGPLAGRQLTYVRSGLEKWFGWAPANGATASVWTPTGLIPPG